ncbi:glycosyltransferase [Amycolatopsis sp. cmx-11-32]|uniref:glycosyltransferase n=1 Tax=Amycolatopsis sp. cmx-11-32 TaxID=2785796 RepID=UPI0039E22848
MITSVGVLIPARDEGTDLPACLRALAVALRELPPELERRVCVVADRCRDDTAELARGAGAEVLVNTRDLTIGATRALGARHLLRGLDHHASARTLLLSTDADTVVDRDWAVRHVRRADAGWDAVAGTAKLNARLAATAQPRYEALLATVRSPAGHGNVYCRSGRAPITRSAASSRSGPPRTTTCGAASPTPDSGWPMPRRRR